jgi:hypothetical protein
MMNRTTSSALFAAGLTSGCTSPLDGDNQFFMSVGVETADQARASEAFVNKINEASDTLHIALPKGDDTAISDAIIAQWESGVNVEVSADYDTREEPAIAALLEAEDTAGGLAITLNNRRLAYFDFAFN